VTVTATLPVPGGAVTVISVVVREITVAFVPMLTVAPAWKL